MPSVVEAGEPYGISPVLRVSSATFPELHDIRGGAGILRIRATAAPGPLTAGDHALTFTNLHLPAISVYLVNALVPKDPARQITRQTRDEFQKTYRLEFVVVPTSP